jgi:hypothetical protein
MRATLTTILFLLGGAASAHDTLHRHFQVTTMSGFGFESTQPCLNAAGGLLLYTQEMLKTGLEHIRRLQIYASSEVLQLDLVTRGGNYAASGVAADGKLYFNGTVKSVDEKNQIWNALKTVPDWKNDINADIQVIGGPTIATWTWRRLWSRPTR